jgi:hypothetical protein
MFGTKLTFSDKTSDAESIIEQELRRAIHPWGVQFTKRIRAFCSKQKTPPKKRESKIPQQLSRVPRSALAVACRVARTTTLARDLF